jgi:hypothetical protein
MIMTETLHAAEQQRISTTDGISSISSLYVLFDSYNPALGCTMIEI